MNIDPVPLSPSAPRPPSRDEIKGTFDALLAGSLSRDEVDRWAAQWVAAESSGISDDAVWWGLCKLSGIDLRHGAGKPYLYGDEQVEEWRAAFLSLCDDGR